MSEKELKESKKSKIFKLFDLDSQDDKSENMQDIFDKLLDERSTEDARGIYNPVASLREAEEKQTAVWKAYQDAIHKAGTLTSEITKGIQNGEKPEVLLLKAVECISLMTGDKVFYENAARKLASKVAR